MDVLYFLKSRTRFLRKFHQQAASHFEDEKRKIRESAPPYDEPPSWYNPEDGEPPFLSEYMDAEESIEFLGQSCVSSLSASLKLFFDETRSDLSRFRAALPVFDGKLAQKKGIFVANKEWFSAVGVDFGQSGADLAVVEEVIITRNVAQHPESIVMHAIYVRGKQVKRRPHPFFVHELERHGTDSEDLQDLERYQWMLEITPEKLLLAIDEVDKLCEFIWIELHGPFDEWQSAR
jgi:hypothetical protein